MQPFKFMYPHFTFAELQNNETSRLFPCVSPQYCPISLYESESQVTILEDPSLTPLCSAAINGDQLKLVKYVSSQSLEFFRTMHSITRRINRLSDARRTTCITWNTGLQFILTITFTSTLTCRVIS